MGIEEQKEEREVLDSIFPDEITGIMLRGRSMGRRILTFFPRYLRHSLPNRNRS